jgi:hypothetical protein
MEKHIIDNKEIKFKSKTINPFTEDMIGLEIKYDPKQDIREGFTFYIGEVKHFINKDLI